MTIYITSHFLALGYNHPSSNLKLIRTDGELTSKIRESANFLDIKLLDHIIVTMEGYYSFVDEGLI
ncbi:MAG: hypothetical protein JST58_04975 [Bacteroidetes bacterium]|nr:hypothetical protein [Bacteroidota bacterium]